MDGMISKQALKQAMYHEAFEVDSDMQKWDGGCWIRYKLFEKVVDIMPSVPTEQKTGRWLVNSDGYYPYCSLCKNEPQGRIMTDYCPNCGARMERRRSNENEMDTV